VTPKCTDDCENPANYLVDIDRPAMARLTKDTDTTHLNATLTERDGIPVTQPDAPPDLWFISNPPNGPPVTDTGTYRYDSTGGHNVVVYILDNGNFDMTLPVRTPHKLMKRVC
jgi:hypothetical protein